MGNDLTWKTTIPDKLSEAFPFQWRLKYSERGFKIIQNDDSQTIVYETPGHHESYHAIINCLLQAYYVFYGVHVVSELEEKDNDLFAFYG